jgi:hypothetical protein
MAAGLLLGHGSVMSHLRQVARQAWPAAFVITGFALMAAGVPAGIGWALVLFAAVVVIARQAPPPDRRNPAPARVVSRPHRRYRP